MKKIITNLILVTIGSLFFAVAINWVTLPNELGEGGITGLILFMNYTIGTNIALATLIINLILLAIGWKFLDKTTILYTIFSILVLSFFLEFVKPAPFIPDNLLTAGILMGILMGIGLGLVIVGNGSTGGTDIIALILHKFTGIPVSTGLLILDLCIVLLVTTIIGVEKGIITMVAIFLTSKMINFIVAGFNPKKAFFIISKEYQAIGQAIVEELDRGVTILNASGFYSKTDRPVLYVVVNSAQVIHLQRLIQQYDNNAFVTISEVQEVHGEGFTYFLTELEE